MASGLQITYLRHSGVAVRTHDTLLVFDDAQGPPQDSDALANGRITRQLIATHARTIFFVSHAHADHFNPAIYDLPGEEAGAHYVLGYDLPKKYRGNRLKPGDTRKVAGIAVTAYGSTDEGVSFLVDVDGWSIFHAGDLNLWHWREESTPKEIEQAEKDFYAATAPLIGQEIDFAFFPVDPRMGEMSDAGALYFLMHVKPRVMIPMHWWDRDDVAREFARRNRGKHVETVALTVPGESLRAEKKPDGQIVIDL